VVWLHGFPIKNCAYKDRKLNGWCWCPF